MADAMKIRGKVVVITGGARGIGLATATALQALGAKIAIGDIDEVTVKESGSSRDFEVYGRLDVTDPASFEAFLDEVERILGPIDVLINNAGIMPTGKFAEEPDQVTRRILDINVYGVILGSKLALARMLPRRSGHVINIASLAGETHIPGLATYNASKHAVLGFTDTLREEYRGSGVSFSSVLPTLTKTELGSGVSTPKILRPAEPEEIADAIVELIAAPKSKVRVTAVAGAIAQVVNLLPESWGDGLARALGSNRAFLDDVDSAQRKAYEERARNV
ncbi:SDR family oxidoreductase [Nocardia cyriacigeorgica]|uniref:SDR family oxidoreductase n=1 Tax=Nocardia cyriacigeorgica TaxID=135487 RepID=UPI0003005EF5|nr:SDR family oxidoreductase [Nocardia cyriacigeorgica]AVH21158.1 SDR family NAD(P)-dependent oxidoreductase [Nocardia cyriacigeorgica]MBF6499355.1 SDR family oxidoreductase [Nocardia cyriacigeorgica]PPJ07583.1 SDR family NAD(P)-dependent oxidoreductase [Nocardia cyriacigeorgica]TLF58333.1 SDR family oxidoreductase [Nocardia cyriacigeorgica]